MRKDMKILVVDDEVEVGNFLVDFLKRLGLEAEKAICGEDALKMASLINPDWVLLDMKMPDFDGLEVLKRMKVMNPKIKSMMITGKSDEVSENEARSLGVRDYLVKPIDLSELRAKIKTYILDGK
jgi:DNA-binding response OmpR family regulator